MVKNTTPLVTSVSTTLRKTLQKPTQVATVEEVKEKKRDMLNTIDKGMELFKKNLAEGKVKMESTIDLERLVKLMLIISGELDNSDQQESTITSQAPNIDVNKIDTILDTSDPTVKELYNKLYESYNTANDVEE